MKRLVVASENKGKLKEIREILKDKYEVVSMGEMGFCEEIVEDGETFYENALKKAKTVADALGCDALADDSGLCVEALNGAPGVYSARYAEGSDDDRIDKLLLELENVPDEKRSARFVSAVCCVFPDGEKITVPGECEGKIAFERHGNGGFGYDPVFISSKGAFGELTAEEKDSISHRGRALEKFKAEIIKRNEKIDVNK